MAKITLTFKDIKDAGLVVPAMFLRHSAVQALQNQTDEYGRLQTQPRKSGRSDMVSFPEQIHAA